jgi:hypothetical protein
VGLVQDDDAVLAEEEVALDLLQQNAVRHELDGLVTVAQWTCAQREVSCPVMAVLKAHPGSTTLAVVALETRLASPRICTPTAPLRPHGVDSSNLEDATGRLRERVGGEVVCSEARGVKRTLVGERKQECERVFDHHSTRETKLCF